MTSNRLLFNTPSRSHKLDDVVMIYETPIDGVAYRIDKKELSYTIKTSLSTNDVRLNQAVDFINHTGMKNKIREGMNVRAGDVGPVRNGAIYRMLLANFLIINAPITVEYAKPSIPLPLSSLPRECKEFSVEQGKQQIEIATRGSRYKFRIVGRELIGKFVQGKIDL